MLQHVSCGWFHEKEGQFVCRKLVWIIEKQVKYPWLTAGLADGRLYEPALCTTAPPLLAKLQTARSDVARASWPFLCPGCFGVLFADREEVKTPSLPRDASAVFADESLTFNCMRYPGSTLHLNHTGSSQKLFATRETPDGVQTRSSKPLLFEKRHLGLFLSAASSNPALGKTSSTQNWPGHSFYSHPVLSS